MKRVRVVVEVNVSLTEKQLCQLVRDNLPKGFRNRLVIQDKRGFLDTGPKTYGYLPEKQCTPTVKEYSRVVEAERRHTGDTAIDLEGLSPSAASAVRALVRSLRE